MAIAGGTGSAKILRGLKALRQDFIVLANVGDNIWMHGLYICPDVDIAMYTLAGVGNKDQGWGIAGDTFNVQRELGRLGEGTWFALGDKDLGTHLLRTDMIAKGKSLTETTEVLRRAYDVEQPILPATDESLQTRVLTPQGDIHLQEFWVKSRGRPRVLGVKYAGAPDSRPTTEVIDAVKSADRIVVCPANPVTSIGPVLAIPMMVKLLSAAKGRVTALSPMIGRSAFSGPAAKMMKGVGLSPDSVGVAEKFASFVDCMIIDRSDTRMVKDITALGVECLTSDTRIEKGGDEKRLARSLLEA